MQTYEVAHTEIQLLDPSTPALVQFAEPTGHEVQSGDPGTPALVQSGGIDKLDVAVPVTTPFTAAFQREYAKLRRLSPQLFRADRLYHRRADLSQYFNVVLHEQSRYPRDSHHKLELRVNDGTRPWHWIADIESIFQVDALSVRVLRVDLAADVADVPVRWFLTNCYAGHKRRIRVLGARSDTMPTPSDFRIVDLVETRAGASVYWGWIPDRFRIYNKSAHRLLGYEKAVANTEPQHRPSFEAVYGHDPTAMVTRIEREMRNRAVPAEFATLRGLFESVVTFDPFTPILMLRGAPEPDPSRYKRAHYERGMGIRALILKQGLASVRKQMNANGGNASRVLKKFAEFLPDSDADANFAPPNLRAIYCHAIMQQFGGSGVYTLAHAG